MAKHTNNSAKGSPPAKSPAHTERQGGTTFAIRGYELACRVYAKQGAALDKVLYDLCKRFPNHKRRAGINAKLLVIGRTYATGIERAIKKKTPKSKSMTQLTEHFWSNRRKVDKILSKLQGGKTLHSKKQLTKILSAHGKLLKLVQKILRNHQSPRSFVSKYLHFHKHTVPIFDNEAAGTLAGLHPSEDGLVSFTAPDMDEKYRLFVWRFWQLYQEAERSGAGVSVKLLDNYLIAKARNNR